eukprot:1140003-Rhodomonas_salina.3
MLHLSTAHRTAPCCRGIKRKNFAASPLQRELNRRCNESCSNPATIRHEKRKCGVNAYETESEHIAAGAMPAQAMAEQTQASRHLPNISQTHPKHICESTAGQTRHERPAPE